MNVNRVAQIIEDVIAGRITDRSALAARTAALFGSLDDASAADLHEAGHYLDDDDIRRRDADYAQRQLQRLEMAVSRLRTLAAPADS